MKRYRHCIRHRVQDSYITETQNGRAVSRAAPWVESSFWPHFTVTGLGDPTPLPKAAHLPACRTHAWVLPDRNSEWPSQASIELRWLQQVQSQAHSAATVPVHSWHIICHLPLVLLPSHQEKSPPTQGACVFPFCMSAQTSVLRWDAVALTVQCMYDTEAWPGPSTLLTCEFSNLEMA